MISYRYIGTYSGGTGDLWTWAGPQSSVESLAPGTFDTTVGVSAFDMGDGFAAVPTDVLNIASPFGSDELNLTSLLTSIGTGSYGVSDASVFNWNGNASTPGFGCDTFSYDQSTPGYQILTDTLAPVYWGEVRNYEISLDTADDIGGAVREAIVSNFQDTDIQIAGGPAVAETLGVQRGTIDISGSTGGDVAISPLYVAADNMASTFVVYGATNAFTYLDVMAAGAFVAPAVDFGGSTLVQDGSDSLVDYYQSTGQSVVVLADDISSNLHVASGTGSLSFIIASIAAHPSNSFGQQGSTQAWLAVTENDLGGTVTLNAVGAQVAHIFASDSPGVMTVSNFEIGRDTLDLTLTGAGYSVTTLAMDEVGATAATSAAEIVGGSADHGIILLGMYGSSLSGHLSTAVEGGVTHLLIA